MPDDFANDATGGWRTTSRESHGKAALLLVESLIHGLIERGTLTVVQAIEIIDAAVEVEDEIGLASGNPREITVPSLLTPIAASLRLELRS